MQVLCNNRGYVQSFAFIGTLVGGIDTLEPEDMDLFMHQFYAFQLKDGKLVYDPTEYEKVQTEEQKENLRIRRETECFSVVNRGQLWYEGITLSQLLELRQWYKAWLDVTTTLVAPDKPKWLT